jgi:hypothetical protein
MLASERNYKKRNFRYVATGLASRQRMLSELPLILIVLAGHGRSRNSKKSSTKEQP